MHPPSAGKIKKRPRKIGNASNIFNSTSLFRVQIIEVEDEAKTQGI